MLICLGYEFSPNKIGIRDGYNKNYHKSALNTMISLIVLRYEDGNIRVILVE